MRPTSAVTVLLAVVAAIVVVSCLTSPGGTKAAANYRLSE